MKKLDLGQTVSVVASIGVIAGIVFLAYELQQNNQLLEAEARATRIGLRVSHSEALFRDQQFAEIMSRAQVGDDLTDAEELRLFWFNATTFSAWEYVFAESERGMISRADIPIEVWRRSFHEQLPRMPETWQIEKIGRAPAFVQWMEENVVNER